MTEDENDNENPGAEGNEPDSRVSAGRAMGMAKKSKEAIEFLGRHPFVTGLLALLGIVGLALSVVGYHMDRSDALDTTKQVDNVKAKLDAISEKIGSSYKGGIFLYEEKIEIYWNDWWAHPLRSEEEIRKLGQAEMTIRGEGKTVDFVGTLSMNCSNGKYFWRGTENFYTPVRGEEKIAEIVPSQIFKNVYKLFCRT